MVVWDNVPLRNVQDSVDAMLRTFQQIGFGDLHRPKEIFTPGLKSYDQQVVDTLRDIMRQAYVRPARPARVPNVRSNNSTRRECTLFGRPASGPYLERLVLRSSVDPPEKDASTFATVTPQSG